MLLEDKPDPGMHALQHPPVLLDETCSQNFVPRDDLIKRMLEYMLVTTSLSRSTLSRLNAGVVASHWPDRLRSFLEELLIGQRLVVVTPAGR